MFQNIILTKGVFFPNLTYGKDKCKQNRILIFCCLFNANKNHLNWHLPDPCKFAFTQLYSQTLISILCSLKTYIHLWAGKKCPCHSNDIRCQMICQDILQPHSKSPESQWELDWAMELLSVCAWHQRTWPSHCHRAFLWTEGYAVAIKMNFGWINLLF